VQANEDCQRVAEPKAADSLDDSSDSDGADKINKPKPKPKVPFSSAKGKNDTAESSNRSSIVNGKHAAAGSSRERHPNLQGQASQSGSGKENQPTTAVDAFSKENEAIERANGSNAAVKAANGDAHSERTLKDLPFDNAADVPSREPRESITHSLFQSLLEMVRGEFCCCCCRRDDW